MFPDTIHTDRLELRRADETLEPLELYEVCSAPEIDEVTEHLPWGRHATPQESAEFLDRVAEQWENRESAQYAVYAGEGEDNPGELAGLAGLTPHWDRRTAGLGMWLRKRFWGRGYSGERAVALAEVAFERLDLACLEVSHEVGNGQSRRAIEKYVERMGGRREGELRHVAADPDGPVDQVRYTITREEYESARGV